MLHIHKYCKFFLGLFLSAILLSSCEVDYNDLGADVLPDSKLYESKSLNIPLEATVLPFERIVTPQKGSILFGSVNDPDFGKKRAEAALEFVPLFDSLKHTDITVDSVTLTLFIPQFYGTGDVEQNIYIHELTDTLPVRSELYTDISEEISYKTEPLFTGKVSGKQNLYKFTFSGTEFGERLANPTEHSIDSIYHDTLGRHKHFFDAFPGLYLRTDQLEGEGAILNVQLIPDEQFNQSYLTVHYQGKTLSDTSNEVIDTSGVLFYNFDYYSEIMGATFDQNTFKYPKRLNLFYHPDQPDVINRQNANDSLIFLQSMGGSFIELKFPGLTGFLNDSVISVNYAQINFNVNTLDKNIDTYFIPPKRISLYGRTENEEFSLPAISGLSYIGGVLNESSYTYPISIASYLNALIKGEETRKTNTFNLFISNSALAPEHLLPHRVSLITNDAELKIIYTVKK